MSNIRSVFFKNVNYFWHSFSRTKTLNVDKLQESQLKRCLNVVDLTALGVGSTLGAGVYVITGQVAKDIAGPAIVLSFLIAAVASLLAALCYAELAARVPRAGSAYIYSYVSVGEFWAFVIGWNLILENMIGAASVGKAWSEYLDSIVNDTIKNTIMDNIGKFSSSGLAPYPDVLALTIVIIISGFVATGVKMSSMLSFIFTVINILVISCFCLIGSFYADTRNWTDGKGFFPYGFQGVLSGAATCFYAFIGFDTVATSGEEAINPTKSIPKGIVLTLLICFVAYFGVSSILTLIIPYSQISDSAGLPKAFAQIQVPGAEYIIAIGGLCGLTASMMGSIFPLPRTIYAMAQDGLVFRSLGKVNPWSNTPLMATLICGVFAGILALLLDLTSLVEMMSIGTLMAYTLVSTSVLILRYQREIVGYTAADLYTEIDDWQTKNQTKKAATSPIQEVNESEENILVDNDQLVNRNYGSDQQNEELIDSTTDISKNTDADDNQSEQYKKVKENSIMKKLSKKRVSSTQENSYKRMNSESSFGSWSQLFVTQDYDLPTDKTRKTAVISIFGIIVFWASFCVTSIFGQNLLFNKCWWTIALLCIFGFMVLFFGILLMKQPRNMEKLAFSVVFVPIVPLLSILINIYLMLNLSTTTWIRFIVWMILGFAIYFGYGISNSSEKRTDDQQLILYDVSDTGSITDQTY